MPSVSDEPSHQALYREPRQARSRETLRRVLRAAEDIVAADGADDLTISGVAQRADVSVGSIYQRFGSKEQLLTALRGN